MTTKRAHLYDAFALLTALIVIGLDQWTKSLVVARLGPPDLGPHIPLIGSYLTFYYIRNSGAAFSLLNSNGPVLFVLIAIAVAVIAYLYACIRKTGPLLYRLVFGLIIGGAASNNLLDRLIHGSVVDFIWFQIPQMSFSFAIFNLADVAITTGTVLFCIIMIFGGRWNREEAHGTRQSLEKRKAAQH